MSGLIILKSPKEIERMRVPCRIVAEVLLKLKEEIKPGVTTLYLDAMAERLTRKHKAVPAFKGYSGYPFSLCCSVNEQVVHGMPNNAPLIAGDIISIDFGAVFDGFYGDAAITVPVGNVSQAADKLTRVTEESLYKAIEKATTENRLFDISNVVQVHAESNGFSVVRDFVGHGIGHNLHESPQVPNFGRAKQGIRLKAGMVLAIEPMINEKGPAVKILEDGWTATTIDGGLSAHFEHTVAITENGPDILSML